MSYTIVGMFPSNEDAAKASERLDSSGFKKEDYSVSNYNRSNEIENDLDYEFEEDQKTSSFWNWLFGDNNEDKKRYSYAGTKSNIVTVYTDDKDRAIEAQDIMNGMGAVNVGDFTEDYYPKNEELELESEYENVSKDKRARIIAKAKSDVYLENNRSYNWKKRDGIKDTMDSQGDI